MSRNEINGNTPPLVIAGLACLLCMPVADLASRPVIWLFRAPWMLWPLAAISCIAPFAVAFIVLYRSSWHGGQPRGRRILSTIMSSGIIFGVDLLLIGVIAVIGGLITGLSRAMGGN
jgi:hypothetical protein